MLSWAVIIAVCFLQGVLSHISGLKPRNQPCRCVSKQWQGMLASSDREFDLHGGKSRVMKNQVLVSYDFTNKRFAMTDLTTGNRAIADFAKGFKYIVRPDSCSPIGTTEMMKQMCIPGHAEYGGEFMLGMSLLVDVWSFKSYHNITMKTTVQRKSCLPVTEEVYIEHGSYASLTSSIYIDVSLGIKDTKVFEPPAYCKMNKHKNGMHAKPEMAAESKRADSIPSLLHLLSSARNKN